MAFLSFFLALLATPDALKMLTFLARESTPFHEFCLSEFKGTEHYLLNTALICGEPLARGELRQLLTQTHLYHLVVVSGAHLVFVENLFMRCVTHRLKQAAFVILGIYALMASWQPPIVRALIQFTLRKPGTSATQAVLISWLFTLALHPQWIHSLSLQLSVAASLALIPKRKTIFSQSLQVLLFLMPLLAGWSALHPSVVLASVILAPISLFLWASTSLVEWNLNAGWQPWNELLQIWEIALQDVSKWQPLPQGEVLLPQRFAWVYVFLLWLAVHFRGVLKKRRAL